MKSPVIVAYHTNLFKCQNFQRSHQGISTLFHFLVRQKASIESRRALNSFFISKEREPFYVEGTTCGAHQKGNRAYHPQTDGRFEAGRATTKLI